MVLRALDSGKVYRPAELTIREYHRFEGMSDHTFASPHIAKASEAGWDRDAILGYL